MSEVELKVRLVHAHDTQAEWDKVSNFIPQAGEVIIFDPDGGYEYSRCKIGNGVTTLDKLPYINTPVFVGTYQEYENAYNNGQIVVGTIVYITDDEDDSGSGAASDSLGVVKKLPKASSSYRGCTIILDDGTNDVAYICLKKNETYLWYPITTGTQGVPGEGDLPPVDDGDADTYAILGQGKLGYLILGKE